MVFIVLEGELAAQRKKDDCIVYTDAELNMGIETVKRDGILPKSIQLQVCIGGPKRNDPAELDVEE